ncbi:MAG TPA: DNA polymerase Y family protein, partial [Woeseiaceae bacterium]|nr:DNA polymerase Y family protein [Woeseiaceae bacterium]
PRAVFEEREGVRQIMLAGASARAMGINPGMSVNAALALLPALGLDARDPAREERVLEALAAWAECFTSTVSLEPPGLLLEIAGSLRLFGGLDSLWRRIEDDLERRGFGASMALAPTPLASLWLARSGRNVRIEDMTHLTGAVASLPLGCLAGPEDAQESLSGMGLTCIGDCLRLPRQGFAKRFGASSLLQLDRALGRLPDPRASYRAPERFHREFELNEEQHDSELLLEVCRRLLGELERFLINRQQAVQQLRFSFFHLRSKATHLTLKRRQAGGGLGHWSRLLALRFENMTLPAPVIAVRLAAAEGEPLQGMTASLPFDGQPDRPAGAAAPVAQLVERLGARLGDDAIQGVALADTHRPQYAWQVAEPVGDRTRRPAAPAPSDEYQPQWRSGPGRADRLLLKRPLWMLPEPVRLEARDEAPLHEGPLTLLRGPERIETGWWDEHGIARDYFVAANPKGVHLWIYRDRSAKGGWFLHGMFG